MTTLQRHILTHRQVSDAEPEMVYRERNDLQVVAVNVIWLALSVVLILLAFRFVLTLFGANPLNTFADFVYTASQPLVTPFFSLFSYNYIYGVAHFEAYTLIAMLVYSVVAWILVSLVTINRR